MSRLTTKRYIADKEQGVALLTMVFCSALFMLLGLSLTFSSMTEFKMSIDYEAREQALLISRFRFSADAGAFAGK